MLLGIRLIPLGFLLWPIDSRALFTLGWSHCWGKVFLSTLSSVSWIYLGILPCPVLTNGTLGIILSSDWFFQISIVSSATNTIDCSHNSHPQVLFDTFSFIVSFLGELWSPKRSILSFLFWYLTLFPSVTLKLCQGGEPVLLKSSLCLLSQGSLAFVTLCFLQKFLSYLSFFLKVIWKG